MFSNKVRYTSQDIKAFLDMKYKHQPNSYNIFVCSELNQKQHIIFVEVTEPLQHVLEAPSTAWEHHTQRSQNSEFYQ